MVPLAEIKKTLKEAYVELPHRDQLYDLAFLVDGDPYSGEVILVYVGMRRGASLPAEEKREIEARLRDTLRDAGCDVFVRWFSETEDAQVFPARPKIPGPVSVLR